MEVIMVGGRSIRRQLLISLSLMAVVFISIFLPLTDRLISHQFEKFQIDEAQDEARRLERVLVDRGQRLRASAFDYADWGQTVDYVQGKAPTYIEENISTSALVSLDTDYIFIVDRALSVRYYAGVPEYAGQPDSEVLQPLPASELTPLLSDPRIRSVLDQPGGRSLIIRVGERWHLVAACPIAYPGASANKPSYGILGFAAELSPQRIERISSLIGVPFALSTPTAMPQHARLEDSGDVVMYRVVADTNGRPMVGLDIRYPQPLADQIRMTRQLLLSAALGIFVIGGILIWLLVDRGVILRLERMDTQLNAIASGEQQSLPITRNDDEVDRLAAGFNRLYNELHAVNQTWRHEALHDPLTGLGNRAQLLRQIEHHLAEPPDRRLLGLLLLDLDGFKTVNDIYGHAVGDRVLKRVAACLLEALPKHTPCFRLGGDEFAVLVDGRTESDVHALASHLNAILRSSNFAENVGTLLSVSIGIAWAPEDRTTIVPSELMQRADIALYSIKRRTRDGYAIFDDSMLQSMQHQSDIQGSLRQAIDQNAIEAWFQPIVSARDRRPLRFEVLARWRHETLGWVAPSEFIPVAEQFHMAAALDLDVLQKGLVALPSLRAFAPQIGLSVNVSAQSLLDCEYPNHVERLLAEHGLCGDDLILEVTETTLTQNEDALLAPIAALHALGIRIELDDFGVGHSSLGRLAQLQPHGIKLDGSFVHNLHNGGDRVCRAVIGMARQLGIQVTAECVESEAEASFLEASGCDALQGFLFSRPMPFNDILTWLSERPASNRDSADIANV
jgi:diguanylate cyclase (GGDEF)-like protein